MKRVLIVGRPGSGKSTLANRLAGRTGLPLTHLDELYWDGNWQKVAPELWQSRLQAALSGKEWIIDGNFSGTLLERAYHADTVIFLMFPRWLCLWRAFFRELLGRYPHGNYAVHWPSRALLQDIWEFGPQGEWQLAQLKTVPGLRLVVLRSDREVNNFLRSVG